MLQASGSVVRRDRGDDGQRYRARSEGADRRGPRRKLESRPLRRGLTVAGLQAIFRARREDDVGRLLGP